MASRKIKTHARAAAEKTRETARKTAGGSKTALGEIRRGGSKTALSGNKKIFAGCAQGP